MKRLVLGLTMVMAMWLSVPALASAAEYETFVGCDDFAETPAPSHICHIGDTPGAFFASDVDTEYEVCVEFPTGTELCSEEELAEGGFLYVNSITSNIEGDHLVTWYVEGAEIGSWVFRMDPVPPAPPPPPAPTPAPVLPAVAPAPSANCLQAQQKVKRLKGQLRNAAGRKRKAKLRGKLGQARSAVKRAC